MNLNPEKLQSSSKKEVESDNSRRMEIEEFPTMGVSWKDI